MLHGTLDGTLSAESSESGLSVGTETGCRSARTDVEILSVDRYNGVCDSSGISSKIDLESKMKDPMLDTLEAVLESGCVEVPSDHVDGNSIVIPEGIYDSVLGTGNAEIVGDTPELGLSIEVAYNTSDGISAIAIEGEACKPMNHMCHQTARAIWAIGSEVDVTGNVGVGVGILTIQQK